MKIARIRRNAPKIGAFVYAGYKWLEDHTDEVERWSAQAIDRSRGKRSEKFVVPRRVRLRRPLAGCGTTTTTPTRSQARSRSGSAD